MSRRQNLPIIAPGAALTIGVFALKLLEDGLRDMLDPRLRRRWRNLQGVPMALFAVTLTYADDTERRLQVRPSHREYLQMLLDDGKLHESGPFVDETGALLVYIADSEAEVREIVANDPYTAGGVIAELTVKEWNVVFSKYAE